MKLQSDIQELKDRIKNLEIRMTKMHKELKEEIRMVSHFLDKENLRTIKKLRRSRIISDCQALSSFT